MARLWRGRSAAITLLALLALRPGSFAAGQSLFERPVLAVDPGRHTARIASTAADAAGRLIATGSYDKTVRIWSASDGRLLRTIRLPAGPGNIGKVYAVAMSPDGGVVAVGGWGEGVSVCPIYLFDAGTGRMVKRIIDDLPNVTHRLAFSADGRYLAAGLGRGGLRVFDREQGWSEAFRDPDYGSNIYGIAFAADGRLVTSSYDGRIRLYDGGFNRPAVSRDAAVGPPPMGIAFRPDGAVIALGSGDGPQVAFFDGHSLASLPGPAADDLRGGSLAYVAWSADGQTLFAAGKYLDDSGHAPVLAWDRAGRGERRAMPSCGSAYNTVLSLTLLPAGRVLAATAEPCLVLRETDGGMVWARLRPGADIRGQQRGLAVSADGAVVDFGLESFGLSPLRFDLHALTLSVDPPKDGTTHPPQQDGIRIDGWDGSYHPEAGGKPIALEDWEMARSVAIDPDRRRFVLGADWSLLAFDADGKGLWKRPVPGEAWAVNITRDGRLVVAAYGDGTIRWHRMDDGVELLALQVMADKKNWVAWTPEGFYGATPGAYGVLRWHVNRGNEAAADTVPVSAIPKLRRADALPLVLRELETARALGIADLAAARHDVQVATGAAKPPGARLNILAIGISDYGDRATQLRLKFADKDAADVANALLNTQGGEFNKLGGLYAEVRVQYLRDATADREGIFEAFASMQRNMAKDSSGRDLAVVMFSGHGAIIDGRFYLLPYGADARTLARLKATGISADDLRAEVAKLAGHGRVLLLLDACHSGAAADGSGLTPNADILRSVMASSNVTVLTSSTAEEPSREDEASRNGAFTKVLIEAFGRNADENRDGLISMTELTAYVSLHLPVLTRGRQHSGIEQRYQSELFVAGL